MSTDVQVLKHARAKIGAKIRALRDRIRSPSLRSSRNSTPPPIHHLQPPVHHLPPPIHHLPPPIHRLPPEIMTQIFMWVQLIYRGTLSWWTNDAGILFGWKRVTRVCWYWRDVALSSTVLYTTILIDHRYSQAILELSGSATLSLISTPDYGRVFWSNEDLRAPVLAALPRVRNLWLGCESCKFLLPHLEKLDIPFQELYLYNWRSLPTTMFPISLRYLRLRLCLFSSYEWLSRLSNMVELILMPTLDSKEIHVDALLNILDRMPRLISLELSFKSKSPSTHVGQQRSQVKPILQYLKLSCPLGSIAQLLPRLTFAPWFKIDISLHGDNSKGYLLPLIFEQIGRHVRASSMILRTVRLTSTDYDSYKDVAISISEGEVEPCIRLSRGGNYKGITFMKCAEALPFDNVVCLIMDAPCDADGWDDSLGYSSTIPRLILRNREASFGFLNYLIATTKAKKGRGLEADTPFKSLEELMLHHVMYDYYFKSKDVLAALTARNKLGFKLRKLTLYNCRISVGSIKKLSKVVDVVEHWPQHWRWEEWCFENSDFGL
ncbi:hypothetical protein BDN72DRAFT_964554 [Pluteus cervinus]|uniref:Uncharacterized protein n=1 Tax=Pluteus cervinus TaxID=181527 RepID=A0ACD3AAT7_9AGAR|nr:hypothetical protein BDN72DRAFT_964554 [Pluteus cervinus]